MKRLLTILLILPALAMGQWVTSPDIVDSNMTHSSGNEYHTAILNAVDHQAYHLLNVIPQKYTGQPDTVTEIYPGPHDAYLRKHGSLYGTGLNLNGELGQGNTTSTCLGCMIPITTDSAGNSLPYVTQVLPTGVDTSGEAWVTFIVTTDTINRQVGVMGWTKTGLRGNGTTGSSFTTKIVWVNFPAGTHIVKITGEYGVKALDSHGNVWSWGYNGNAYQVARGASPDYMTPHMLTLPTGHYAVDLCDVGAFGVILLEDGELLVTGDHPKYAGGPSMTASTTPQNITSWFYSQANLSSGMTGEDTIKTVDCNNAAVYYISVTHTLYTTGDNATGSIGNGQMLNWAAYKCCPAPNSGSPAPFWYDGGYEEFMYTGVYNVAPGYHNWKRGYMGKSNFWTAMFTTRGDSIVTWGPNKAAQAGNGFASCNYPSGGQTNSLRDALDMPNPTINPNPLYTTVIQVNCAECYTNPHINTTDSISCSQCTLTQGAAPTVNAGANQTISATSTTMSGSFTAAGTAKKFMTVWSIISQPAGANAKIMWPSALNTQVTNLAVGTTILQLTGTDNVQMSATSYDTIVVQPSNQWNLPIRLAISTMDTVIEHTVLASAAGMYTLDTLTLPPNSAGLFRLYYFAFDTVMKYTGMGRQEVMLSRLGNVYQAPYTSYYSPYVSTGLPTHQVYFTVQPVNGLVVVEASGFGAADPIRWHVLRDSRITPL